MDGWSEKTKVIPHSPQLKLKLELSLIFKKNMSRLEAPLVPPREVMTVKLEEQYVQRHKAYLGCLNEKLIFQNQVYFSHNFWILRRFLRFADKIIVVF